MEKFFPHFGTLKDVRRWARAGAIAGYGYAAMVLISGWNVLASGLFPGNAKPITDSEKYLALIGTGIEVAVVLFLSWRLSSGKGHVSAIILLAIFLIAVLLRLVTRGAGLQWILVYASLAWLMLNGIRACRAYKRVSLAESAVGEF